MPAGYTSQIASRRPLESDGNSGNPIEWVTLRDGRRLVLKRVSPQWDWMARETHDDGRLTVMWESGLLGRVPDAIDHTIVAVERDGETWNVFMDDASGALVPRGERFDRAGVRRILETTKELHDAFWGAELAGLCTLADRYSLFSPATGRRELERASHHGVALSTGWEAFFEHVPEDIGREIGAIHDRPERLTSQLARCDQTLIHGDLRLGNLGFARGRLVLIDWGERVGIAPPAAELGWFLGFDGWRLDVSNDDVVADFRALYGERCDERALNLSLIGALVQIGGLLGFWLIEETTDAGRAVWESELTWWTHRVRAALEA